MIRTTPSTPNNPATSTPPGTRPESPADGPTIEALHRAAFGPGAYARAAFRVREQAPHDPALSFVTELDGVMIASVRLTPIEVGDAERPSSRAAGRRPGLQEPRLWQGAAQAERGGGAEKGEAFVILVGDQPYYCPFGFRRFRPARSRCRARSIRPASWWRSWSRARPPRSTGRGEGRARPDEAG